MQVASINAAAYRGAPLGKLSTWPEAPCYGERVHVRRVHVNRSGCATDGTYWGLALRPELTLWNVHTASGSLDVYLRAVSREAARRSAMARTPFILRRGH